MLEIPSSLNLNEKTHITKTEKNYQRRKVETKALRSLERTTVNCYNVQNTRQPNRYANLNYDLIF